MGLFVSFSCFIVTKVGILLEKRGVAGVFAWFWAKESMECTVACVGKG